MAKWSMKSAASSVDLKNLPFLRTPPTPKQRLFMEATERFVGYGGARGGGKSWAVRRKAILLACFYGETPEREAITILIVRRTLQELYENHIRKLIHDTKGLAEYRDKHRTLEFKNGARIVFGYMENEKDADQYQGNEYDVIFIDEATQISEYMFNILKACVRGTKAGVPKRIYCTCNPKLNRITRRISLLCESIRGSSMSTKLPTISTIKSILARPRPNCGIA